MILSRSADYGLRALIYLAQEPREGRVPLDRIARAQRIPPALLSKVLQQLVRADILRSHRGYGGGFTLAVDPVSVTLDRVIVAIDGPFTVFDCLADDGMCSFCHNCKLRDRLGALQATLLESLRSTTLVDCLPAPGGRALPLSVAIAHAT